MSLLTLTPATQQAILAIPKEKIAAVEKEFWKLASEQSDTKSHVPEIYATKSKK